MEAASPRRRPPNAALAVATMARAVLVITIMATAIASEASISRSSQRDMASNLRRAWGGRFHHGQRGAAPAPAPAGAPAGPPRKPGPGTPALGKMGLTGPEQGFEGAIIEHQDKETMIGDWQREFGPKGPPAMPSPPKSGAAASCILASFLAVASQFL